METALRYEIEKAIPDLKDNIFPTNAPEGSKGSYSVYARISTKKIKTLEGIQNKEHLSFVKEMKKRIDVEIARAGLK